MSTVHEILAAPWRAVIRARRTPSGWALSAGAEPVDGDLLYGGGVEDHAYWMGLRVGEASRWHASSAARSEERFVDDSPAVDDLWVVATGAIDVEVHLWLRLGDGATSDATHEERAFRARTTIDAEGTVELPLESAAEFHAPRAVDARAMAPREVVSLTRQVSDPRVVESARPSWARHTPFDVADLFEVEGSSAWVAGRGHARRCELASGAILESHVMPVPSSANVAFGARARRLAWHEVFDYDEPLSAIVWFDLEASLQQVLVPDVLDLAPVVLARGEIVAWGRRGVWYVDPERKSAFCITRAAET